MQGKIVDMSLPSSIRGYVLTPDDGEALWFNKGLLIVKATAEQTEGKYSAVEMRGRKGFSAPLHVHHGEDEFFIVMSGDVRFQLGDEVFEAKPGSLMYGPREVPHSFHVDSTEARLLLLFGPAGTDKFFRAAGKPARSFELPPADEEFLDRERLMEIGRQFDQEFVGPPLPPKS